jgi:hypothetical protein
MAQRNRELSLSGRDIGEMPAVVNGDKLRIRGPKRLGPLALAILDRKAQVFPIVAAMGVCDPPNLPDPRDNDRRLAGDAENGAFSKATTNHGFARDQWAQRC